MLKEVAHAGWRLESGSQQNKDGMTAAGALPLLVTLLGSNEQLVLEMAALAVWQFAAGTQQNKDSIIAAGALPSLVTLLGSACPEMLENAARSVCLLATGAQQSKDAIIAAVSFGRCCTHLHSHFHCKASDDARPSGSNMREKVTAH